MVYILIRNSATKKIEFYSVSEYFYPVSVNTNEFKAWMDARGLKTKDVAASLHVEEQTIRIWRSQGVPPRRQPHVEKYMAEWLPPSAASIVITDEQIATFQATQQNLVLKPTEAQFDAWSQAATAKQQTIKTWALAGLDQLAAQTAQPPITALESPVAHYGEKQA